MSERQFVRRLMLVLCGLGWLAMSILADINGGSWGDSNFYCVMFAMATALLGIVFCRPHKT